MQFHLLYRLSNYISRLLPLLTAHQKKCSGSDVIHIRHVTKVRAAIPGCNTCPGSCVLSLFLPQQCMRDGVPTFNSTYRHQQLGGQSQDQTKQIQSTKHTCFTKPKNLYQPDILSLRRLYSIVSHVILSFKSGVT